MNIIKFLTPVNLEKEKEKFFSSDDYNPRLEYSWKKDEIESWLQKDSKYSSLYKVIFDQNEIGIVEEAKKIFFTTIDEDLMSVAEDAVKKLPPPLPMYSLDAVVREFQKILSYFDLNYEVFISDSQGFNIRPHPALRKIEIGKEMNMQFFSPEGEVKHELVHVLRYENGKYNNIEKSVEYLPTEEGLSSYFQDYKSEFGNISLFQHAAEYTATSVALKGSMRDVFNYLCSIGFDKENAWGRSIRHKYGFKDTSKPGDIMKPSMYFYHEQKIKQLTDKEKLRLMVGKIHQSELDQYKEYKGKIPKQKLVDYYQLDI